MRLTAIRATYVKSSLYTVFPAFVLGFIALLLLTLITFSLPFIGSLYFLRTSQAGGVRFGIWGWCLDTDGVCSDSLKLGYTWEPQVAIPITKALALYPVSAISTFMTLISLIPIQQGRRSVFTLRVFAVFAWCSFTLSLLSFTFMISIWGVARKRFERAGWAASYGPLPWMSLVATLLLFIVALSTWRRGALSALYLTPSTLSIVGSVPNGGKAETQDDPEKSAATVAATNDGPVVPPLRMSRIRQHLLLREEGGHPKLAPLTPGGGDKPLSRENSRLPRVPRVYRHPSHRQRSRSIPTADKIFNRSSATSAARKSQVDSA